MDADAISYGTYNLFLNGFIDIFLFRIFFSAVMVPLEDCIYFD